MNLTESTIKGMLTIGTQERVEGAELQEVIDEMMSNLAISTPILRITREVLSRNFEIINSETKVVDHEITNRIKKINGFEDYLQSLAFLVFGEFCVHEKVFGNDENESDLRIYELVKIPNVYVNYDNVTHASTGGIFYTDNDGKELDITNENFLISVYGFSVDYPLGYGLFRYGIQEAWEDLVAIEDQMRALRGKYGGIIPVFGYNPADAETKEGRESLQTKVDAIREMNVGLGGQSVLGIPLGRDTKLSEGFQFINLSNLSSVMHTDAETKLREQIETFLMGANFSDSENSSSNAAEEVQSTQKDRMMNQIVTIIEKECLEILKVDAELFGYDYTDYTIQLAEFLTQREQNELELRFLIKEKQRNDNMKDRATSRLSLVQTISTMKYYGMEEELIASELDVSVELVQGVTLVENVGISGNNTVTAPTTSTSIDDEGNHVIPNG